MTAAKVIALASLVCLGLAVGSVVLAIAGAAGFVRGRLAQLSPNATVMLIRWAIVLAVVALIAFGVGFLKGL